MIKIKILVTTALGVILFTGFLENSAEAYQFFSDRGSWTLAVQGLSITTEQFNIPDQVVRPLPFTFPSGFKEVPTNALGGSFVSNQELRTGLGSPGSLDEFAFPSAVKGFGFNFETIDFGGFGDKSFSISGIFGSSPLPGTSGFPQFFGVVADANDALIQNFQILGSGEIGQLAVDNVSFAKPVPVPEPTTTLSLLALGSLGAASALKCKLKTSKPTTKELEKVG